MVAGVAPRRCGAVYCLLSWHMCCSLTLCLLSCRILRSASLQNKRATRCTTRWRGVLSSRSAMGTWKISISQPSWIQGVHSAQLHHA